MPTEQIQTRTASDGYSLHYRHYPVNNFCRGWVVLLHGIQSHSGWYRYLSEQLSAAGFNVRFLDRRGSGLNEQQRGHVDHHERWIHDVVHLLNDVHAERRDFRSTAPVILGGISWGGKLAKVVAQLRPDLVDALTLITPGIFAKVGPTFFQQQRLNLAKRLGIRQKLVTIPLQDSSLFTSESESQDFIRNDKLGLHEVTTSFLYASQALDKLAQEPTELTVPLLLMLAERDQIIDNERTRIFFKQTVPKQNMTICYKNVQHTLELETCRDQYVSDMIQWLLRRKQK